MSDTSAVVGITVHAETAAATQNVNTFASAWDSANKTLAAAQDRIGKAMDVVNRAVGYAAQGWDRLNQVMAIAGEAARQRQIETAFRQLGVSIDGLSDAADRGVSKLELMQAANKALRGESKLTEAQFKTVLAAADHLSDAGFGELIEIQGRLVQALKTGSARSLRELGITVDDTGSKFDAARELMTKFKAIAADDTAEDSLSKRYDQMSARIQDLTDSIKKWVGNAVLFVVDSFDEMVNKADELIQKGRSALGLVSEEERRAGNPRRAALVSLLGGGGRTYSVPTRSKYATYRPQDLTDAELDELARTQNVQQADVTRYTQSLMPMDLAAANARRQRGMDVVLGAARSGSARAHDAVDQLFGAIDSSVSTLTGLANTAPSGGGGRRGAANLNLSDSASAAVNYLKRFDTSVDLSSYANSITSGADAAYRRDPFGLDAVGGAFGSAGQGLQRFMGGGTSQDEAVNKRLTDLQKIQDALRSTGDAAQMAYSAIDGVTGSAVDSIVNHNGRWLQSIRSTVGGQLAALSKLLYVRSILEFSTGDISGGAALAGGATLAALYARQLGNGSGVSGPAGGSSSASAFNYARQGSNGGGQNITVVVTGESGISGDRKRIGEVVEMAKRAAERGGNGTTTIAKFST